MKRIIGVIDSISEYAGKGVRWLCLAMIFVLCYEVIARYAFNAPTLWAYEVACSLGLTIIALGWSYTHLHLGHIKIDVFYVHFSPRKKALADVISAITFFLPLSILWYIAAQRALTSWTTGEVLKETFWYPPAAPIKTVFLLGLSFFVLQGVSNFVKDFYLLIRGKPYD